jgi:hypothetical protein
MPQQKVPAPPQPQVPAPPPPAKDAAKKTEPAPLPPPAKDAAKKTEPGPTLPPPRPAEAKEAAPTPEAAPEPSKHVLPPLAPAYPSFADPRSFVWTQHRLPPADQPGPDMACQMQLCLNDHRCLREKIIDYIMHFYCPSRLICGKCCPENP